MINFEESNMVFQFPEGFKVVKLDDSSFYKKHYVSLTTSKSIDFLIFHENTYFLIEVKNFKLSLKNKETKNRFLINTSESLSLEMALKVRDSLACILGASRTQHEEEISEYKNILKHNQKLKVILFIIPPNFYNERELNDIKMALSDDLKKKLKWLNAKIHILDEKSLLEEELKIKIEYVPTG